MDHTDVTTPDDAEFEKIVHCTDPDTGLDSVIAIHSTTLGPSLGGIRMKRYPSHDAAAADAKRLAQAMSYKAAMAGLDLGGGKSVINADPTAQNRAELLLAHGRAIEALGGQYIPAVDMGTTIADLDLIAGVVTTVSSRLRDPSEFTAAGVVAAIRAAVQETEGVSLDGVRIGIQGLGNVGARIALLLFAEGARLVVADIDTERAHRVAASTGAQVVSPAEVLTAEVDVLCPCAAGGVVTTARTDSLPARYVIGAANNVLADPALAARLRERDIVHVPDFVANAGGLIACAAEVIQDDTGLHARVENIGETTLSLLRAADVRGQDTVTTALQLAKERIADRRAVAGSVR
ncbi:Glu/Leu/Phe/Val family dehydrogenase [Mycolicibacterium komossense]|uniref:Glu/Leu/Phe/Val dehydrogenase n=1 Tax=Mycolicibacterium komossense TaxID=1779 RepID=A0ABT3CF06_9MYCO|nr:Glu/Leu/Phe/Val dehydrogenase dimerization domain-containing protein [Mycolicibacterium komossense]MCV7228077.1 Glu/Leu/Phe/Val dehydrogenase [Mycolicibacterium komossense]